MRNLTTKLLWIIYIGLLVVLLPHTAWLFAQFEPLNILGDMAAWAGAFAFEASIAALTHKLARHIEAGPKRALPWTRFRYRYLNAYAAGLILAVAVSALANLAHAVQFGKPLAIFTVWGIEPKVYQLAFGAILPLVSLLFARVLSNVSESEEEPNTELDAAKAELTALRRELREANARAEQAELRLNAVGDLVVRLFGNEKRERILAAVEKWPKLTAAAIAVITETSPSYVSEVLHPE